MLPILYLVLLCSNFLLIKSEDDGNLIIKVKLADNCRIKREGYTFTEGQNVTLIVQPHMHINYGWWSVNTSTESKVLYDKLKTTPSNDSNSKQQNKKTSILYTRSVDSSMGGTWEFKFYFYQNNANLQGVTKLPITTYSDGDNYTISVCKTNVTIVPRKPTPAANPSKGIDAKFIIIVSVVFSILVSIIIAQAAYIVFLKAKARELLKLNTHNNLSKKSESISNDTARYCTNPGQKMMKEPIPVEDDNRDSIIYEAPNIEISSNGRMPMHPPQPPAIQTIPRTPRSDHKMSIGPQGMLASALNSPARSPVTDRPSPNFQRPKYLEGENSVANRPPFPLPPQGHPNKAMFQEVYEEMETQGDIYEPPPVTNTVPPRLPMPPKKVPTGNLLDVKENTLKLRQGSNKPPVTPKPQPHRSQTMTPPNELEQALRRRNNAERESTLPRGPPPGHMMQSQHQEQAHRRRPAGDSQTNELEEALRRRNNGSGPPPVQKSRPPPVRHPVQEEIYYNEASDEEEWTYEPLKPLNSYDQNIYNI